MAYLLVVDKNEAGDHHQGHHLGLLCFGFLVVCIARVTYTCRMCGSVVGAVEGYLSLEPPITHTQI